MPDGDGLLTYRIEALLGGAQRSPQRPPRVVDPQPPAGAQHPAQVTNATLDVTPMVLTDRRDDQVESLVGVGQRGDVADREGHPSLGVWAASEIDHAGFQIDGVNGPGGAHSGQVAWDATRSGA